ncbi:FGGY family carbohydrate kinase [Oryzifoliimicrobium ureilyticus]|uniref:FGGY family carbohydrate kinase n=1 Tax=Oryzifoliimicrobium ureilyticus TaxID=3113724 RepID=UPI00307630E4
MRAILAIDQGTTNSKAVLVSKEGRVIARGSAAVGITYPQPGWVEQDPNRIYASVCEAVAACLSSTRGIVVEAVAISNQRESVTAWDAVSGRPLGPVLSWQCRRTASDCERLIAQGHVDRVQSMTGLPLDPMFPGSKFKWLLDRVPAGRSVRLGTIDSWLIHCLTGGEKHLCDASNASRSQLYDLKAQRWSNELGEIFEVDIRLLPEVLDSCSDFGTTRGLQGVPDGTPIRAAIGDSHAALFGHGAFKPGDGKVTFGTGSSVMTTLPRFVAPGSGITTTTAWRINGQPTFAFEGNILVSAASLPWMSNILGLPDVTALVDLAATAEPNAPAFVPAFVGLGAPYWDSDARALFSQINFSTTRAQMARSVTDSVAFQVHDVIHAMSVQSGEQLGNLFVDGGPSQNNFLMQTVANLIDHPVIQCKVPEASALGAAYLAGLAMGVWSDLSVIEGLERPVEVIQPAAVDRPALLKIWNDAVARSTLRPTPAKGE